MTLASIGFELYSAARASGYDAQRLIHRHIDGFPLGTVKHDAHFIGNLIHNLKGFISGRYRHFRINEIADRLGGRRFVIVKL